MLKFTPSQDGKERATVHIPMRLTREEIAAAQAIAKHRDVKWRKCIASWAALALESEIDAAEEEASTQGTSGEERVSA